MQIGAADAAVTDADEHFAGGRLRKGYVDKREWIRLDGSRRLEDTSLHVVVMFCALVWMRLNCYSERGGPMVLCNFWNSCISCWARSALPCLR